MDSKNSKKNNSNMSSISVSGTKSKSISIDKIINEYVKKICDFDNLNKNFDEKLSNIELLTDNLIDYCIKKKIFYFIENKINYTSIILNFKSHLANFIKNIVDPNDYVINKYVINVDDDNLSINKMGWDNVSDLNSIMFKNFKNLNESFEKNVSFGKEIEINNYDDGFNGFELNNDANNIYNLNQLNDSNDLNNINNFDGDNISLNSNKNLIINNKNVDNKILPIYIKLLINQNKYVVELIDKLISMCDILSNPDVKYKKNNPYN